MLARCSVHIVTVILSILILSLGCAEPDDPLDATVELPTAAVGPVDPESTITILVIDAPNQEFNFTVYAGKEQNPELRLDAQTEDELAELITAYVENTSAANPALDTVLIESDGGLRTGDIEFIKSAIQRSVGRHNHRLYVGIREEGEIADDN